MKKIRPVVFVIDKTCGSVLNDAMQALDWVFAEARDRGMSATARADLQALQRQSSVI